MRAFAAAPGRRWLNWLGLGILLLAPLWLYWPALRLPLIYDTLLHIRIAKGLSWVSVWRPTEAFGFYRPFTFLPFLAVDALFGYYPSWLLQSLNLIQHSLNGLLLALLVTRLWHRRATGFVAGLLFALFPFSYQAVAVYGHNVHPHLVNVILLWLHAFLNAREKRDWRLRSGRTGGGFWWTVSSLLFIIALLSHESAILLGLYAGLVHRAQQGRVGLIPDLRRQLRLLRQPSFAWLADNRSWLIWTALGLVYFFTYQFLPISRAPQAAEYLGAAALPKALYLAQAAAYPLLWQDAWSLDIATIPLVSAALALMVLVSLVAARRPTWRWPLFIGWAWWALASLLLLVTLPTGYLLHGPRLLYLGGVGVVLIWSSLLGSLADWRPGRARLLGPGSGLLALMLIAAPGWLFVRDRLAAYANLSVPVDVVATTLRARPPEEGVLLVNLPQWIAPGRNRYPVGVEFVAIMADYLFAEELIEENVPGPGGIVRQRPVQASAVFDLTGDTTYSYGVHNQTPLNVLASDWAPAGSHVFVSYYRTDGVHTDYTGRLEVALPAGRPVAALGPYQLMAATARQCGAVIRAEFTWQVDAPVSPTTSIFVQLFEASQRVVAQADGPPLNLRPDLLQLEAGWQIVDRRHLALAPAATPVAAGPGTLLIGAYDFTTGRRYPGVAASGEPLPDDAWAIPVTGCS